MVAHAAQISDMTLIGVIALAGWGMGRMARLVRLPSLIGFMILGVFLGPSLFGLFGEGALDRLAFITQIALGFVAFSIGAELSFTALRRLGASIVIIIFAESLFAFFVVVAAVWWLTDNLPLALVFGSVAPASAPAGTVAVIQELRAKGPLTKALYAVVGFDDGLAIVIFGLAAAVARKILVEEATGLTADLWSSLRGPMLEIVGSLALGTLLGFAYCQLVSRLRESSDMLVAAFAFIVLGVGMSERWHLSLILVNLMLGIVLVNTRREELVHRATEPLRMIMPLLFILFFCLAGAHLDLAKLPALGSLGLVYILGRSAGLVGGARFGAVVGKADEKIRKWLGLGILSQAGVAIGLALMVQQDFGLLAARHAEAFAALAKTHPLLHPVAIGGVVITTVTATSIVFEIVGPILTRIALVQAGEAQIDEA